MAPKASRKNGRKAGGRKAAGRRTNKNMVSVGRARNQQVMAPVSAGNVLTTPQEKDSTIYCGFERLLQSNVPAGDPGDQNILTMGLSPIAFAGTRVAIEAENWAEFYFEECEFTVIASNPTAVGGSYEQVVDLNTELIDIVSPATYIGQVGGAVSSPYWQSSKCRMPKASLRSNRWFKVDPTNAAITADNSQGIYRLCTEAAMTGVTSGNITLIVWVRYRVRFAGRKIKEPPPPSIVNLTMTNGDVNVDTAAPGSSRAGLIHEDGWGGLMKDNWIYAVDNDNIFQPLLTESSPPIRYLIYIAGDVQVYGYNSYQAAYNHADSTVQGTGVNSTLPTYTFPIYLIGPSDDGFRNFRKGQSKTFRIAGAKSPGDLHLRLANLRLAEGTRGGDIRSGSPNSRGNQRQTLPANDPEPEMSSDESVVELVRRPKSKAR